jgi:Xaa-Pro dipeptidase
MNSERLARARQALVSAGVDALVCRLPENVLMLSGYWPLCGDAVLVFPVEGEASLIVPDTQAEEASAEVWDAKILSYAHGRHDSPDQEKEIARILTRLAGENHWNIIGQEMAFDGIAASGNAAEPRVPGTKFAHLVEASFKDADFVDAQEVLDPLRKTKTSWEIEKIRLANELANIGIDVFFNMTDAGRSAIELAAAVEHEIVVRGTGYKNVRRVRAFAQVAAGNRETSAGWRPFEVTTATKLQKGDLAILELAVVADGYWADRTRARSAGPASEKIQRLNGIVRQAQDAALAAIGPGVQGGDVDAQARGVIVQNGHGREFVHITGHGVGFRYHEGYPILAPESRQILLQNAVVTVEPGIYSMDFGGIRIEDNIVVTERGFQILAPFSREIA